MEKIDNETVNILLIDDDEDEYIIARDLFSEIGSGYNVVWTDNLQKGLEEISTNKYEICLCDYNLGEYNGINFIEQAVSRNTETPVILLTGQGDHNVDMKAMKAGATDYLDKNKLDVNTLERAIRYALERKKSEERIRYLAFYDQLTNLPNRTLFLDRVHMVISSAKRHKRNFAIMFLDIDNFKRINDTLGHNTGDVLIKEVSKILLRCIRREDIIIKDRFSAMLDTVARLGGDEFTILLSEIKEPENASIVAERIRNELRKPISLEGKELIVTVSIGISIFPNDGEDVKSLLKSADIAMYNAKYTGKNGYQYYDNKMNTSVSNKLNLEIGLNKALENGDLNIYYQPIIDLSTDKVFALEALLRWHHSEKGIIMPGDFMPVAEEIGIINVIGNYIFELVSNHYKKWQSAGLNAINIAFNISPKQLNQKDFFHVIEEIIKTSSIPPDNMIIEITENNILNNMEKTNNIIAELKNLGIKISLDDFGSGYSSFLTLKKTSLDYLKIDPAFIKNVPEKTEDSAIVAGLIAIGRSMNLKVVAEGIERKNQLEFLKGNKCDYAQGFLIGKPSPENEILKLLETG